jgi:hypothetical protein
MRTSSVRHDESALESVVVAYAIPSVAQLVTLECDVGAVKVQSCGSGGGSDPPCSLVAYLGSQHAAIAATATSTRIHLNL